MMIIMMVAVPVLHLNCEGDGNSNNGEADNDSDECKSLFNICEGSLALSRAFGDFQYKENTNIPLDNQMVIGNFPLLI